MGTSQSSPGSGGKSPLVPPWADDQPQQPLPPPPPRRFQSFRRSLGNFVRTGDNSALRSALGHYASKGTGGGGIATRRLGSVTQSGGSLFEALTSGGVFGSPGQEQISLNDLSGQPCEIAIARISQALSSGDGDADKIRIAMNHALTDALDGVDVFDPGCITDDIIVDTMIGYLAETVFLQIVMEGGNAWNKAETILMTLRAEDELREVCRVVVDKYMAPKFEVGVRTFSRNEFIQIEKQVIIDVWAEWEGYQ